MSLRPPLIRLVALAVLLAALVSCGLVVSFASYDTGPGVEPLYGVSGTADGIGAVEATVALNGLRLPVADGSFAFSKTLHDGAAYVVSDALARGRVCTVESGMGTIAGADATGIEIHCLPSSDATLSALTTSAGPLARDFDPKLYAYDVPTSVAVDAMFAPQTTTVTAENESGAQILINGVPVASRKASAPIAVLPGPTSIGIDVTAADGTTRSHYALTVAAPRPGFFKASNTRADAHFGTSIAFAGDTLVVGAPMESSGATGVDGDQADQSARYAGAVYVYKRSNGKWAQQAYLKASNARANSYFGWSVAISASGDTVAVGAPQESGGANGVNGDQSSLSAPESGAVYVFTRTNAVWSQQAYVKTTNTRQRMRLGESMVLDGNTLAVAASSESSGVPGVNSVPDGSALAAGAVYVFTRTDAVWSQQAYIKASNPRRSAFFGRSIALDGDTLAAGSDGESSTASGVNGDQQAGNPLGNIGAAYVFVRKGGVWSQQAYIKPSYPHPSQVFGQSIAVSGNTLAVGASGDPSNARGVGADAAGQADTSAPSAGAAYVFTRTGDQWSQQAYVKPSNTSPAWGFGHSVALAKDALAVGARGESEYAVGVNGVVNGTSRASGAVYVYARVGGTWSQRAYVKAPHPRPTALFGQAVAFSGNALAVGADEEPSPATGVNGDDVGGVPLERSGAVYIFQ